jgi:hypothetical protein
MQKNRNKKKSTNNILIGTTTNKPNFSSVKIMSLLSCSSLCWRPYNQIANVDFLLITEASGGLHRARCFGGLQLLTSVWSVFSCRRFLLVWNGWVRQWCFQRKMFLFCFNSVFSILFWL